jgi:hypothetical protein
MAQSFLSAMARMSERARVHDAERQQRALERQTRQRDKSDREAYAASRETETQAENRRLIRQIEQLERVLSSRLGQDPSIDFKTLFKVADERALDSVEGLTIPDRPILENYLPKLPSVFVRWLPPDLPLNFHPAVVRASANVTPLGAVSVPA